jgi:hypothetical protein
MAFKRPAVRSRVAPPEIEGLSTLLKPFFLWHFSLVQAIIENSRKPLSKNAPSSVPPVLPRATGFDPFQGERDGDAGEQQTRITMVLPKIIFKGIIYAH